MGEYESSEANLIFAFAGNSVMNSYWYKPEQH